MDNKMLVTYATMSGSTAEIAGVVKAELEAQGLAVDLLPCRAVHDLKGYAAVVLGTALYMFHFHRDAARFLTRHQKALKTLPTAFFAGGPYGPNVKENWVEVNRQIDSELQKYPWFQPLSIQRVGGRFDPALLRFPYNLIPALKQSAPVDDRNWEAIRAWAASLLELLVVQPTGERLT